MIKPDLVNYLRKEIGRGTAKETLMNSLKAGGWAELDINDSLAEAMKMPKATNNNFSGFKVDHPHHSIGATIFKIIFILIISFLVIAYILGGQP